MLERNKTVSSAHSGFPPPVLHEGVSYHCLMASFECCQTARIKPVYFKNSCAPFRIPFSFLSLMPDVFKIIEDNFNAVALGKSYIGVFGLQPVCAQSKKDAASFYCTLLYLTLSHQSSLKNIRDWQGAKSLVIDFSGGYILSPEQYLSSMLNSVRITAGRAYGRLPPEKLALVWKAQNSESFILP